MARHLDRNLPHGFTGESEHDGERSGRWAAERGRRRQRSYNFNALAFGEKLSAAVGFRSAAEDWKNIRAELEHLREIVDASEDRGGKRRLPAACVGLAEEHFEFATIRCHFDRNRVLGRCQSVGVQVGIRCDRLGLKPRLQAAEDSNGSLRLPAGAGASCPVISRHCHWPDAPAQTAHPNRRSPRE